MWRETLSAYKAEVFNQLADITPQGMSNSMSASTNTRNS